MNLECLIRQIKRAKLVSKLLRFFRVFAQTEPLNRSVVDQVLLYDFMHIAELNRAVKNAIRINNNSRPELTKI